MWTTRARFRRPSAAGSRGRLALGPLAVPPAQWCPMSVSDYIPVRDAARIAQTLDRTCSVLVYRTRDGRVAAVWDGLTGYGPDRAAALRALARMVALAAVAPKGCEPGSP